MPGRFRLPMFAIAAALFGLIVLLATLQDRWLGQISSAERERMKATLNTRAAAFAQDFDREVTRAYLLFQLDPMPQDQTPRHGMVARYDRWQATARFPRMIKDVYVVPSRGGQRVGPAPALQSSTRFVEPGGMARVARPGSAGRSPRVSRWLTRAARTASSSTHRAGALGGYSGAGRAHAAVMFNQDRRANRLPDDAGPLAYRSLVLDREYMMGEMLPALAQQHFRGTGDGFDYRSRSSARPARGIVYHTVPEFSPGPGREGRRHGGSVPGARSGVRRARCRGAALRDLHDRGRGHNQRRSRDRAPGWTPDSRVGADDDGAARLDRLTFRDQAPMSIVVQQSGTDGHRQDVVAAGAAAGALKPAPAVAAAQWRLLVTHPSGSLEAAVSAVRRRNLIVSSSILGVLGVSVGFLVLSDAARAGAGAAADGIRRHRVARAAHAARRHPFGRRQSRRRRRPRRRAGPEVRRAGARRGPAADRDGRAGPGVRRHPVGPAGVDAAAGGGRARCCATSSAASSADRRRRRRRSSSTSPTDLPPVRRRRSRRCGASSRI